MDPLKHHLLEQAEANRWINRQWWQALEKLSVAELDQPQGGFFGSIWGTWNHVLLTDRLWLGRVIEQPFAIKSLGDRLCDTKAQFQQERVVTDQAWIDAIAQDADVARTMTYRNSKGVEFHTPLYQALQHLFMHQAHHRAQLHQMCSERKIALSDGGLIGFYRSHDVGPAVMGGDASLLRRVLTEQAAANHFINREWWGALKDLPLADLDQPQGAFFGSIFGTWNHLLLGDRIWLGRLAGRPLPFVKLSDRITHTVSEFLEERERTDHALMDQVAAEPDVTRVLVYRGNQGQPYETPLYRVFQHMFAHQAHHRGQIHQMCDERKIALPDGGLIGYYRTRQTA